MKRPPPYAKKYPRTPHLPWSPGSTSDDVIHQGVASLFYGKEVVVTEKVDGENTTMYRDYIHARSLDSRHHASRSWVKALHHLIHHLIPVGWRVCGENLYAKHAIEYDALPSYFMVFCIFDEVGCALDIDATLEWCELLGLAHVPILYRGMWDEPRVRDIDVDTTTSEGFVVRLAERFAHDDFAQSVAKWVRRDHVDEDATQWMYADVIPNKLLDNERGGG